MKNDTAQTTPAPMADAQPVTAEYEKLTGCFCGLRGLAIEFTTDQAETASHSGQCYDDARHVRGLAEIQGQLAVFSDDELRAALRETGAWGDDDLQDREENEIRAVWLAASDALENSRE